MRRVGPHGRHAATDATATWHRRAGKPGCARVDMVRPCRVVGDVATFDLGGVVLTRVPYFDIGLDPAAVGLTVEDLQAAGPSGVPWTDGEQVLVGQAVWVVASGGRTLVVDPCGAADTFIRSGPAALEHQRNVVVALEDAGFALDDVDVVVLTHLDGIGMAAGLDDAAHWHPLFPRARVVLTRRELDHLATEPEVMGLGGLQALEDAGVVDGVDDLVELAPGVTLEHTGCHSPGHAVIHLRGEREAATMLGHLALSPIDFAVDRMLPNHEEPEAADALLRRLASEAADDGRLLVGPLWPWPGACRLVDGPRDPRPATPS